MSIKYCFGSKENGGENIYLLTKAAFVSCNSRTPGKCVLLLQHWSLKMK
uniref:Uncharacterized protein n=1 Tax=Rhizophora mucronata TaxID=61149 RepID=A0A2P2QX54_RHIMU